MEIDKNEGSQYYVLIQLIKATIKALIIIEPLPHYVYRHYRLSHCQSQQRGVANFTMNEILEWCEVKCGGGRDKMTEKIV